MVFKLKYYLILKRDANMFTWTSKKKNPIKLKDLSFFQSKSGPLEIFCDYLTVREAEQIRKSGEFEEDELVQTKTQKLTRRLLDCVKQADLKSMDELMQSDPGNWSLMFNPIDHILADGKTIEIISPLKYATKIFDTYSRNQLLRYVPDKDIPQFMEHVRAQQKHIDLDFLFRAYTKFYELYHKWLNQKASNKQLADYWNTQHGKCMRELGMYACHFIKEMCRHDCMWGQDVKFDVDTTPAPVNYDVYDHRLGQYVSLLSILPNLGFSFSLMRGTESTCGQTSLLRNNLYSAMCLRASADLAAFRRLLDVRREDLAKQLSMYDARSMRVAQKR